MNGRAIAPAAGTVLNALATGIGSAFAIDSEITATVQLTPDGPITGEIADAPDADTRLIERCVELVVERFGDGHGGTVRTQSEIPMAAGLKSSSAAANATVLATLDALDASCPREDAARIGVTAARDTGVTVTGAFDDASASMLGGLTITDNARDELLDHDTVDWDVLVWTPNERAFSTDADVDRCKTIAPMADLVADLAMAGDYGRAMTVNGLAYSAALGFPTEPLITAMPHTRGVTLSGTGPSFVAVGDQSELEQVQERWNTYDGNTWLTTTRTDGAQRK
ncbi:shikimate kinase [Halocatena pleomorpha]|uniref:Shikimate kinase n=1 Tax=Halocatena pleomorpha TaxID=1785090 RepID=A0A3P3RMI2_9EURY|nr:shikimate kinase [Halocatena pleomorpha]RRJ33603.1 shikimate kinase [Halocatena pleomorpha]